MRWQRHDRYATDLLQSKVQVGEFDDVRQLHDHAVEGLETFVKQIQRQPRGALIELSISDQLIAIYYRYAIAVTGEDIIKDIPQRTIFPIALRSITCGKLGGESNNAVKHSWASLDRKSVV